MKRCIYEHTEAGMQYYCPHCENYYPTDKMKSLHLATVIRFYCGYCDKCVDTVKTGRYDDLQAMPGMAKSNERRVSDTDS